MNAVTGTRFHPLSVAAVERLTDEAVAVTLLPPPELAPLYRFLPGQYLTVRRVIDGEEVRRSYSICAGLDDGALRIGIKRVPGGRFSGWATTALAAGDVVEAMPPEGSFVFRPDATAARTVVGIAAGSGITPILAIARTLLAREPQSRFVLLYGNRSTADVMFRAALDDLKDRHLARFTVLHVLSREASELAALHGRLDEARIRALLPGLAPPGAIAAAYLCGPAGLPEAATAALLGLGVAPARIHVERFTPAEGAPIRPPERAAADAPTVARLRLTLDGTTREVPMAEGETVLEAGLRAGIDVPWSCRGGMCCTCRARVTAGAVEMDHNYSLQPWETEAGFVLTCQSRPRTPLVAVDYDAV
ncbi:2Fe-2S iron-sulfur cluster binding domain-containing protein [Elioraea sp. Yellowstone]|jgi:ring-1,2-phenylacetyl-CoA epoxidase subunit PaaE|uniref:2Fe-2S iron-sulfur cluster-binding protein n=1 Tax=Elioraea sp. Yellowstone TaxID=2592070 RepID=UPI0011537D46|nr:2Fe-2S iron-sulfur cluster-binding protein [Elioraea sp. Yellowstone]TQF77869.1 2Fe-2S iron-sulfur cluster binding domain-containing protein [Elioraea sp. Yellowstone]